MSGSGAQARPGTHDVLTYASRQEVRAPVVTYLAAGLGRGERCLYILGDRSLIELVDGLDQGGIDAARRGADGSLQILRAQQVYLPGGSFEPRAALQQIHSARRRALRDGYAGLRMAAEMGWALASTPAPSVLLAYEEELERRVLVEGRFTALCLYDLGQLASDTANVLAEVHASHRSS